MEHPRKRKASQSSPVQDHLCLADDTSPDCPPPAVDTSTHRAKRLRLSLGASNRSRTSPPPRRRGSPPPVTQVPTAHEVYPGQQYSLHRGPSAAVTSGSLLSPLASPAASSPITTVSPQFYVPPNLPGITRETLRELDLESILKNPQLRHDLMFDPGLQFRPTTSRRKQLTTDRYWTAVTREVEYGCTCVAWDASGAMVACRCGSNDPETRYTAVKPRSQAKRTRPPTPPPWSDRYYKAYLKAAVDPSLDDAVPLDSKQAEPEGDRMFQINVPSRVAPMLHELVAVLKSVIVPPPLSSPHTVATTPSRLMPPQSSQSSSDVQYLLSHFDPPLIEREMRCGVFDPSGLFGLVGETLKRHCAPMRDRQVDNMMSIANGSEGNRTERTISTMRMCFEILELMKLDIANHQLQHLRPFLAASTPDFEMRIFIERCRRNLSSVCVTRTWLQNAWEKVNQRLDTAAAPIQVKQEEEEEEDSSTAITSTTPVGLPSHRHKVHMSLIEAITGFVFNPLPCPHSSGLAYDFPETLYLDKARVTLLAADAADLTALYMLLMLWRQLVFWNPANGEDVAENQNRGVLPPYRRTTPRLEDWEVDRVKREIWEIGPRRIGSCFLVSANSNSTDASEERAKWQHAMQNVALQITARAEEARTCTSPKGAATLVSAATRKPPSQPALNLMSGWIQTHMRRDSVLAARFRELLRQEVAEVVTRLTFVPSGCSVSVPGSDGVKAAAAAFIPGSGGGTAGLEPLMPEIRHLAQRLGKLVLVNMRVYWCLYEGQGFLLEKAQVVT